MAGCAKAPRGGADGAVRVSPTVNPERGQEVRARRAAAGASIDPDDWRKADEPEDAGNKEGAPPATAATDAQAASADDASVPDPKLVARAATEASLDRALGKHSEALRRCYVAAGATGGASTIRLRVHRTGYVVSSKVDVGDEKVRRCITGVLSRVRVSDMKTDSIEVERTLRFTRQQRGAK